MIRIGVDRLEELLVVLQTAPHFLLQSWSPHPPKHTYLFTSVEGGPSDGGWLLQPPPAPHIYLYLFTSVEVGPSDSGWLLQPPPAPHIYLYLFTSVEVGPSDGGWLLQPPTAPQLQPGQPHPEQRSSSLIRHMHIKLLVLAAFVDQ